MRLTSTNNNYTALQDSLLDSIIKGTTSKEPALKPSNVCAPKETNMMNELMRLWTHPYSNFFSQGGWKCWADPMTFFNMFNWMLTSFPLLNTYKQILKLGYHQPEPDLNKVWARHYMQFLSFCHTFGYLNMLDSAFLIPVNLGCIRKNFWFWLLSNTFIFLVRDFSR